MSKAPRLIKFEQTYRPKINRYLAANLKKDVDQAELNRAMNFSVLAGGKRLRPMLTIATLIGLELFVESIDLAGARRQPLLHGIRWLVKNTTSRSNH